MFRVEITLKSGAQAVAHIEKLTKRTAFGGDQNIEWNRHRLPGQPDLYYLNIDEVAAIVTYDIGSVKVGGSQDERDGEAAQSGGDQLDLERDPGSDSDTEQHGS